MFALLILNSSLGSVPGDGLSFTLRWDWISIAFSGKGVQSLEKRIRSSSTVFSLMSLPGVAEHCPVLADVHRLVKKVCN